ncbi:MAG TPA: peptide-methionine (R)-S-oxide reductase MsrB [Pirellulaceae bacterium]|nr:peptide-methionine (R)-S-oxide reductase MsrB [Pirellulaceae bacterium]
MTLLSKVYRSTFASVLFATGGLLVAGCDEFQEMPSLAAETAAAEPPARAEGQGDVRDAGAEADRPQTRKSRESKGANMDDKDEKDDKVVKTEAEWKKILTPEEFYVLRKKGTELPFQNKYDHHFEPGTYVCAGCGAELFESDTKFNSGCGWPAFYAAKAGDRVKFKRDLTNYMVRVEVTCARCGGHLGHVFNDAPNQPTGQRYCINSVSMKFVPREKKAGEADAESKEAAPAAESK